ncbi:PTS sugar transporter subunit IIB [Granulicatella seriolae]|jgi:PTS system ascorbate-specific IIB component|uniref:PTS sugar transporter subunit IIB n=1 Tax=Granulicatella seriolae TaxID=2967226 RepID=A0ABT1WMH4_9LACT|nr:PTS sugar transporter subunit IIB [Granulicatella seriolae]
MYKALVACRAGVGSSLMLKIKVQDVITTNNLPIQVEHSSLDGVPGFPGQLIITLVDVADELREKGVKQSVIGVVNIMDKKEILAKLTEFLENQK